MRREGRVRARGGETGWGGAGRGGEDLRFGPRRAAAARESRLYYEEATPARCLARSRRRPYFTELSSP